MKLVTVVGARPQFIKLAPVTRALRAIGIQETIVHTGQHYDPAMSQVFFDELEIPAPDHHLNVGSGSHGAMTGEMLRRVEQVLLTERPDWVMVYGDTNSTLAGALAAAKLNIPVAHVEAGLRSFNRRMPEEINRILTDDISSLLFCPNPSSVKFLAQEGISAGVHEVGDVMQDVLHANLIRARRQSTVLQTLRLQPGKYFVVTVHRAENADAPDRLTSILQAITSADEPTVFPVHPRTKARIEALPEWKVRLRNNRLLQMIEPLSYIDLLRLTDSARAVLTDSGGLQKEAFWLGVPCLILRDETEWIETLQCGHNVLVGADYFRIVNALKQLNNDIGKRVLSPIQNTASKIAQILAETIQT